ncbi:crotonase/enoyl-CoA hydratase family protein [Leucobacter aridicollis]|uniref:Enoyl-CoA hydratase n=1 Tax=Leucobacter aridicollis TaxID=283878 RepID=A0A852RJY5_9MICO|nr:crotonase/enoyl-CoA hydratase family protein [Leucobacter aridicollis]MBL3681952.1 crotonase/enoyl-CoA hydratase family protein [Leucobacter aridicollis]NYD27002.1 enoyl-CoA hydratase [Leucobacter aridicollis]
MDFIRITNEGPVRILTFNRPDVRNAVHRPMASEITTAVNEFEADDSARVLILTGTDGTFCAGADLAAIENPTLRNEVTSAGDGPGPMGHTRLPIHKPAIAAIEGHAVAGGLELALLADLRIMAEDAILGVFCRRFGVPLIDGGTVRLPRIIGLGRALDLILTGRPVGAEEAHNIGLANRVTKRGESLRAALELAHTLAAFPQECMLTDRASTYDGLDQPLSTALRNEGRLGAGIASGEGVEGARRFLSGEGRHGVFPFADTVNQT